MAMTKEAVEQEIVDLLLAIQKAEDSVEVERLTKTLTGTLAKVVHDNIPLPTLNLRGGQIGASGVKILAKLVYDLL